MMDIKGQCRCNYTSEKETEFIDTIDDVKGETAKIDESLGDVKIQNFLKYERCSYLFRQVYVHSNIKSLGFIMIS